MTTLRSPKDLIGITSRDASKAEGRDFGRIGSNQASIEFFKNLAVTAIRNDGKYPEQYQKIIAESAKADRGYWAALMLKRLYDIEQDLTLLDRISDAESVRRLALHVIHQTMAFASEFHGLTISDNEMPIATGAQMLRGLDRKRAIVNAQFHTIRSREWNRWNAEAKPIWMRQPQLSRQAVATRVKANLRLREAVRTIAKKLKKPVTAC